MLKNPQNNFKSISFKKETVKEWHYHANFFGGLTTDKIAEIIRKSVGENEEREKRFGSRLDCAVN